MTETKNKSQSFHARAGKSRELLQPAGTVSAAANLPLQAAVKSPLRIKLRLRLLWFWHSRAIGLVRAALSCARLDHTHPPPPHPRRAISIPTSQRNSVCLCVPYWMSLWPSTLTSLSLQRGLLNMALCPAAREEDSSFLLPFALRLTNLLFFLFSCKWWITISKIFFSSTWGNVFLRNETVRKSHSKKSEYPATIGNLERFNKTIFSWRHEITLLWDKKKL